jgi:hypothetical protein
MPSIVISPFAHRQTPESKFSHFTGSWETLLGLVQEHFSEATPGYRSGVLLIPSPPEGFWSSTVILEEGDQLAGVFERRAPGEEPRKSIHVVGRGKQPAGAVDIVLYRHDVLLEGNEQSCDADWEVIAVLARCSAEPEPMSPGTLMANHFQISGGTATNMDDSEFVGALKKSFLYWGNKALSVPS